MPTTVSFLRSRIRLARAARPGRSAEPERRATFTAALQQFDELLDAATAVGPSSRPLPLFYALSQAGRAIAAAHRSSWEINGHGLVLPGSVEQGSILDRVVRPKPRADGADAFARVTAATGSAELAGPVTLEALWRSLPDLSFVTPEDAASPRALLLRPVPKDTPGVSYVLSSKAAARIGGLPAELVGLRGEDLERELGSVLKAYPSAAGWRPPAEYAFAIQPRLEGPLGPETLLEWEATGGSEADRLRRLSEIAPEHRYAGERWIRPALAHGEAPSGLMTWWALLYGLSSLARYEPALWTRALDVDKSMLAVALEVALDEAMDAVPHLVHDALYGQPALLARPR